MPTVAIPWGVVDESQFTKIIAGLQSGNCTFTVNNDIHRTTLNYIPRASLISLIEN